MVEGHNLTILVLLSDRRGPDRHTAIPQLHVPLRFGCTKQANTGYTSISALAVLKQTHAGYMLHSVLAAQSRHILVTCSILFWLHKVDTGYMLHSLLSAQSRHILVTGSILFWLHKVDTYWLHAPFSFGCIKQTHTRCTLHSVLAAQSRHDYMLHFVLAAQSKHILVACSILFWLHKVYWYTSWLYVHLRFGCTK